MIQKAFDWPFIGSLETIWLVVYTCTEFNTRAYQLGHTKRLHNVSSNVKTPAILWIHTVKLEPSFPLNQLLMVHTWCLQTVNVLIRLHIYGGCSEPLLSILSEYSGSFYFISLTGPERWVLSHNWFYNPPSLFKHHSVSEQICRSFIRLSNVCFSSLPFYKIFMHVFGKHWWYPWTLSMRCCRELSDSNWLLNYVMAKNPP